MKRQMPPVHPGEILLEDFLKPMGITQYKLAKSMGVPQRRIGEIVAGKRSITADTALRLAKVFGTDAQSWMNLQTHYDLAVAEARLSGRLEKEVTAYAEISAKIIPKSQSEHDRSAKGDAGSNPRGIIRSRDEATEESGS